MEETTEAHMETDVTSTTEDEPDTQEVTGSTGNVEMVIVVEKVDEDEIGFNIQKQELSSLISESTDKILKSNEKAPQKDTQSEIMSKKSPTKYEVKSLQNVTQSESLLKKSPIKELVETSAQNIIYPEMISNGSLIKEVVEKSPQEDSLQEIIVKKPPIINVRETSRERNTELELVSKQSIINDAAEKLTQNCTQSEIISNQTPSKDAAKKSPQKFTQSELQTKQYSNNDDEENFSSSSLFDHQSDISSVKDIEKTLAHNDSKLTQKEDDKNLQLHNNINELPGEVQEAKDTVSSTESSLVLKPIGKSKSVDSSPNKNQKNIQETNLNKDTPQPVSVSPSKELILRDSTISSPVFNEKSQNFDNNNDSISKSASTIIPIDINIERDTSNDSQLEAMSVDTSSTDMSEREQNKSISRELKSLIKSAKESKIINECTQIKSKRRKSISKRKSPLNTSINLNTSIEADKIQGIRRTSVNSQKSSCSEKSEKVPVKRSMRSQNPEFVNKVKQFLSSVTGKYHKDSDDDDDEVEGKTKEKRVSKDKSDQNDALASPIPSKMKKIESSPPEMPEKLQSDLYCWRCHWAVEQAVNEKIQPPVICTVCPRSFHYKCLTGIERSKINAQKSWVCPECMVVLQAESSETRSQSMKKISLSMLCDLLKYALERMMDSNGVEPFMQPVDRTAFPDYDKYVVHPMDLSQMQANIAEKLYGSTEAFLADANWILHNSIIFNTLQSKLTSGARALLRSCRAEMGEIEACPECYAAAHARKPTWFTDVCTTPHILLWAKLKGFPYWPAKGMSVSAAGLVDVRFFGAHDRAWVPAKDCFLYSERDPNNFRTKRQDIIDSMQEAEEHIRNISRKYGKFVYPPFKTQFDPTKLTEQIKMMIPTFEGELQMPTKEKLSSNLTPGKKKRRSHSNKSVTETGETEIHDNEQLITLDTRKMVDGAEIAREDNDTGADKQDVTIDVDVATKVEPTTRTRSAERPSQTNTEISRKRRYSVLEEAVITVMDSNNKFKRRKSISKPGRNNKKMNEQKPTSGKEIEILPEKDKTKDRLSAKIVKGEAKIDEKNEPSSSTKTDTEKEKSLRVTPIRIAFIQKDKQHNLRTSTAKEAMVKIITPGKDKDKNNGKATLLRPKLKVEKLVKSGDKTPKPDKLTKSERRRNSKNNRSLSNTPKMEKIRSVSIEKKTEKTSETSSKEKIKEQKDSVEKPNENGILIKEKESESEKSGTEIVNSPKPLTEQHTSVTQQRLQFDDDTSLAIIARESKTIISSNSTHGLPTISSVRSLSVTTQITNTTSTKTTTNATSDKSLDINSTQPSKDNTINDKITASKLQKLSSDTDNFVGRVGVRAFARMTSPEKSPQRKDCVEVEIKAEPVDVDDPERQIEKLNLMNAFRLRPVNPSMNASISNVSKFSEPRLNKVVVTPPNTKKTVTKVIEIKPRAKKSFPQPKKPEDGQLNSKNSMVYIPIQPPITQAPVRATRVVAGPTCPPPAPKPLHQPTSTVANSSVNTVTTPMMAPSMPASQTGPTLNMNANAQSSLPSLGQVPAAVHTVPLMTSVNGQWMFSLQPIMSVGALDSSSSPPIANGVSERGNTVTSMLPLPGAQTPAIHNVNTGCVANGTPTTALLPTTRPSAENSPGDLPRLLQRPTLNPLDANTPIGNIPAPSIAGPLTAKLNQNAVKMTDFFRTLLEDSLDKLDEPATQITALKLQLEQVKWRHQTEIDEIKHNHELTLSEMRALFEKEKIRAVSETRRSMQIEMETAVKATKAKQWCANCSQEAQFYCCWNTSYCDYPCQRAHWTQHFNVCTQQRQDGSVNGEPPNLPESRLRPQPDMPKNTSAPALTVGGKLAPSRIYTQEQNNTNTQKSAIIVSMIEDKSGNQTMKCVGTYKSNSSAQNVSPIIINKQIMNNEESPSKKVVSTGGYLIVGGGTNNSTVVTQARRGNTIQYYT